MYHGIQSVDSSLKVPNKYPFLLHWHAHFDRFLLQRDAAEKSKVLIYNSLYLFSGDI